MGIYISNLEMPTNGDCISLKIYPDGGVFVQNTNYGGWKAITVPDHGRLGDLEALAEDVEIFADENAIGKIEKEELLEIVRYAPTIIPADKEEG